MDPNNSYFDTFITFKGDLYVKSDNTYNLCLEH